MENKIRYDALYARQSVEKQDSISIESQLSYCRYETRGNPYIEYADKGYSGKNIHRPDFSRMMADIRQGRIARVIVYKLDRISRSILDFANMIDMFSTYQVEFISSTERFDTSTPMGRAMLHICIVFAQLERETIQKRVSDAYAARSRKGFYMGGRIPYGFTKKDTTINGVHTAMYVPIPKEAEQLRLMYQLYADTTNSLGDIITYFAEHGICHLRGGTFTTSSLSRMLRNPIYVRADEEVYHFFVEQGARLWNPASDFAGWNGCYLYRNATAPAKGKGEFSQKEVVLAPHEGIVPAADWLACQRRCVHNRCAATTGKGRNSWLCGKVKCGRCGYALTITTSRTYWQRYFVCSAALSTKKSKCIGAGCTIYADVLEDYIFQAIRVRLEEISRLFLEEAADKRERKEEGLPLTILWDGADFQEKQKMADILIEVITIVDGRGEIYWRL